MEPVSQSSYLNERDRHYRADQTIVNAGELAETWVTRALQLDQRLQQARAEGASPMVLAMIEKMAVVYGAGAGGLIDDFMNRPYERW